jgi:regulatory protein YycI of two-component signal transduction system YycFG
MNLSRAKTVLIYTFLLLNVFLCYQLWQDQGYGGFAAFGRKEEISRLEGELQKAGLLLETDLPKTIGPMAYLVVEPWHYSPAEVIASFWEILEGKG